MSSEESKHFNSKLERRNVKFNRTDSPDESGDDNESYSRIKAEKRPLVSGFFSKKSSHNVNFTATNYSSINAEIVEVNQENVNQSIYINSNNFNEALNTDDHDFLSNKFESLDYDKAFNLIDLNKDLNNRKYEGDFVSRKQLARWFVMFLIGISTGLVAVLVDTLVEKLSGLKYSLVSQKMEECIGNQCLWQPLLIWISSNMLLSFGAVSFCVFLAPAAAGSGIPMVKCYLNGIKIPNVVRFKTLIAKVLGLALAVSGGLACGKEGPMIHSGSIIAAGISQGSSSSMKFDLGIFKYFRSDTEKRDFVSGGAAAGVAAAFGAPVGGVLFSLEEGASFWNQALTWRIFFGSMISTFTLNTFLSLIRGNFGDLSNPGLINFGKFSNITYKWYEIPIFILMGVVGGILGALFNSVNIRLTKFRNSYVKKRFSKILECLLVAAMSAILSFLLSYFVRYDCQPIGRDSVSIYSVQLFCDDGQYNAMAALFFQTPEKSLNSLFHDPPGSFNPITLGVFCVAYFILAVWTYGLAVPSGVFIPSLLIGAAWGRLTGIGISRIVGGNIDPGKYALIGAVSSLGGILRMTLSLAVIVTEATGDISLGLPIMFALMAAKLFGDLFNEGLFDYHIQLSGIPLLAWDPPPMTEDLNAKHIMTHPVLVLREVETVKRVWHLLRTTEHYGFPVVEGYDPEKENTETFGILKGFILRHQLLTLLKKKSFLLTDKQLTPNDFREFYPTYLKLKDVQVEDHELDYDLDLKPYMNLAPYSLNENSNLPRIFRLFRGLGLRHIVICDKNNNVVGIVTRIDVAKYRAHVGFRQTIVKELKIYN